MKPCSEELNELDIRARNTIRVILETKQKLKKLDGSLVHRTPVLHTHLHSAFVARFTLPKAGKQIGDIVPRMPIQASPQALLIKVMCNQTNASAQHEQTVQDTHAEVVFRLFLAECATVAEKVNEADGDTSVHIENQIVFLRGGDRFHSNGVIEHLALGEVGLYKVLDKFYPEIGVVA